MVINYRDRPVPFRPGDTVAAALVPAGELTCRVTGEGEPRGVFCGMGVCHECLVTIDGVPGQRACMVAAQDGMRIEPQPARPAVEAVAAAAPLPQREIACDMLVVGGGPAGLAAAAAGAETGLHVVLVDERAKLGGQYFKQPAGAGVPDRQHRAGSALIDRAARAGVDVLARTQVWSATAPGELNAVSGTERLVLRPRRLVLATGAYECGVPLPGWTLPGVMATGAAQTLLRAHGVVAGRRVLVAGNGPLNMQVAAELARAGAEVVALAELARAPRPAVLARMLAAAPDLVRDGIGYQWSLRRRRVPVLQGATVIRVEGAGRAERAVVARFTAGRPVAGSERAFAVDAVCVGFGFSPATELARSLGCRHRSDGGQLATVADARGRSSVDGVWVVGDGAGVRGARIAQAMGLIAGADAARSLGARPAPTEEAERALRRHRRFQAAMQRAYAAPRLIDELAEPDTPVCRCESVAHGAIAAVLDEGVEAIGAVKRITRAGMGGCQGRYCGPLLAAMSARRSGRPFDEYDWFAPSAPFKPLPVGAIAGAEPPPVGAIAGAER